ncbi:MAG TPA: hypothetical protein VG943_13930 [Caulobacterales bacterium]|nr:hypothetical protein [Caulobacterales bacterium]
MTNDTNPRAPVDARPRGQRFAHPVGRTAAFVRAVIAGKGRDFAKAWLSERTCQFEDCVIWTHDLGATRLIRLCGTLITEHRIVVRVDDESRAHFRRMTDADADLTKGAS